MNGNNPTPQAAKDPGSQQPALAARLQEIDTLVDRARTIEERLEQLAQRFDPVPSEAPVPEATTERPTSYGHHMSVIVSSLDQTLSRSLNALERIETSA